MIDDEKTVYDSDHLPRASGDVALRGKCESSSRFMSNISIQCGAIYYPETVHNLI